MTQTRKQPTVKSCPVLPVHPHHFFSFHPGTASLEQPWAPYEEETEAQ